LAVWKNLLLSKVLWYVAKSLECCGPQQQTSRMGHGPASPTPNLRQAFFTQTLTVLTYWIVGLPFHMEIEGALPRRGGNCNDRLPVMYLRGRLAGLWPSRPRTMRFPYIRSEPATKAKRQRSVFASLASLIASWIYYTLLHPYTVVECIIYPSQPDLTLA
jgi:hypothetical protein